MAHMQYMPGDPRLVDQLVHELKSKGIFDQFRKECIADVDTRPAYQNLRQRVESSVSSFLSRQIWKPDLNKNQLREKLRKHLLDGNYLEQGVERIVDQVVNPKVASVFIPQVEDVVYSFLGIPRQKTMTNEAQTSNGKVADDLLPTDLEAVSPGSVKSNDDKNEDMDISDPKEETKMDVDDDKLKLDNQDDSVIEIIDKEKDDTIISVVSEFHDSDISIDKNTTTIPLPAEEIKLENIPAPVSSPPNIKDKNIDLEKINLPKEPNLSTDIPLPDEMPKVDKGTYFKPMTLVSDDDESSSDSSLIRNMSPLTPIRNFNNENSCDAQQGFDNDSDEKGEDKKEPSSFRFTIEAKSSENSTDAKPEKNENETEKKDPEQALSYQFNSQVNINSYNSPVFEDSSNSHNLQIDYESDANSKATTDIKAQEPDQNSDDSKKERKTEEKSSRSSSNKSSHRSRDSHRHSSSKDKRSESKHSSSRDSSRHDKKSSKDDKVKSSSHKDKPTDRGDKKDGKDSSKYKSSSHKSSSSSSKDKDKHRSSSSSKHSSKHDERKSSSSSSKDKEKDRTSDKSKDRSKDSKSSSHRSDRDKDKKSSSKSKSDERDKDKKEKKETDDHYSLSGRGNPNRRSTDRDSNDGSSSSKGSQNQSSSKSSDNKKDTKSSSKSGSTSTSGDSASPSEKEIIIADSNETMIAAQLSAKPVVRVDTHLKVPITSPPRLPFVPDVTLKKPKFAANLAEAKKMMKMRKFLEDEQKRMNQEAALLLEFQANVRPSLSQVYSSIPGPELEFACVSHTMQPTHTQLLLLEDNVEETVETNQDEAAKSVVQEAEIAEPPVVNNDDQKDSIAETLIAMHLERNVDTNMQMSPEKYENSDSNETKNDRTIEQSKIDIIQTLTDDSEPEQDASSNLTSASNESQNNENESLESILGSDFTKESPRKGNEYFEVTIITEELSESEETKNDVFRPVHPEEKDLYYFAEHEKYESEVERRKFAEFYKEFVKKAETQRLYLINCDSYEENLIREVSETFGNYEIVNYHKNGHLKLPKTKKNIINNVNFSTEIALPTTPIDRKMEQLDSPTFSPVKSESSFELHSDYDAKLQEMVNKTSRKEIMEIILGNNVDESPSEMPKIDYCMESSIESGIENCLKRKISEVETNMNNNRPVLTPNKIRKMSGSDQISSTTEESNETPNNKLNNLRSKYLGKARRVGLPKPKKTVLPNSPSSDKSVENYAVNSRVGSPRGRRGAKLVQRYDTSDLYKPKLHYLSRRNISLNE